MQKLLAASSASSFRSNSIIAHKALPPCKTSGQHLTGEHAPIWKASLLTEKKNHKDSIKKLQVKHFPVFVELPYLGMLGKSPGDAGKSGSSPTCNSANSLIRNTICAIKAGVYSWFLRSSLDFSHALRKAEMLLKSMLHTAAWEAFPAVRSFCSFGQHRNSWAVSLFSSNTTPVCKYHFHVYSCIHCFSRGFYFKFPAQESSPLAQESNVAVSMTTPISSKKKITRTLTRF